LSSSFIFFWNCLRGKRIDLKVSWRGERKK
jgi:hypothetical protein